MINWIVFGLIVVQLINLYTMNIHQKIFKTNLEIMKVLRQRIENLENK